MNLEKQTKSTIKNLKNIISKIEKNLDLDFRDLKNYIEKWIFKKRVLFFWWEQISWSLSPFMHTYSSLYTKESFLYTLFETDLENLEENLKTIEKDENILWANITMPLKIEAYNYLKNKDKLDKSAKMVWAINTIAKNSKWEIVWYNSDIDGIKIPIENKLKERVKDINQAYVFWAWWASRAIVAWLIELSIKNIIIFNKSSENPNSIIKHFEKKEIKDLFKNKTYKINYIKYDVKNKELRKNLEKIDKRWIIINSLPFWFKKWLPKTPIKKEDFEKIKDKIDLVFDIVYDIKKDNSYFLDMIEKKDIIKCNWKEMLIYQAIKWFELWTKTKKFQTKDIIKFLKS